MTIPRVLIAGVCGGSGKTLVSLGLLSAWRKQGHRVAPFKKGPDYIDAAWLSLAAGRPCRHLDLFLMSPQTIVRSFAAAADDAELAVIEGNRGLYDGMDAQGTCSTAEVAKLLACPVILAVNCTKATRTIAALVLGCQHLDPQVSIRGVILNQTAGPRHEAVLREAIQEACGLPVLGTVPRIAQQLLPERHLGLVPPQEHDQFARAIAEVAELGQRHLDLAAVAAIARDAPERGGDWSTFRPNEYFGAHVPGRELDLSPAASQSPAALPLARIGVFRDAAFQFYYPDNLEALQREGASVIEVSPLRDTELPPLDALYIGGGFPETQALALAENKPFLDSLRRLVEKGLPVYAECGGAVFLGETLVYNERQYPLAGIFPVVFAFAPKPQGHGYTVLETVAENPFYPVGHMLRGHEFHYTYMQLSAGQDLKFAFRVQRGFGFDGQRDGLCHRNVLASYMHVHALGTERWAPALVQAAVRFRSGG